MSKTRVAIIGAGPAGLAAADYLSRIDAMEVEIFEAGRKSVARICPVDRAMSCSGCAGSCNVLSGVGGCIQPGDSIKLSMFPSGKRLIQHIGADNTEFARSRAMEFFDVEESQFATNTMTRFGSLDLRHYQIHEVGPEGVQRLHSKFQKIIGDVKKFHTRVKIQKLTRSKFGIRVHSDGANLIDRSFDRVIIATGRTGYNAIINASKDFRVTAREPNISIGLRLELPAPMLLSMFQAHKDFKFSKMYAHHKVKSFCFSSSELMGGRLKFGDCIFDKPVD